MTGAEVAINQRDLEQLGLQQGRAFGIGEQFGISPEDLEQLAQQPGRSLAHYRREQNLEAPEVPPVPDVEDIWRAINDVAKETAKRR